MPEEERIGTTELRKQLLEMFKTVIDSLSNKQLNQATENLVNAGLPAVKGLSRQEYIQVVTDRLDDLNREALIVILYGLVGKLREFKQSSE